MPTAVKKGKRPHQAAKGAGAASKTLSKKAKLQSKDEELSEGDNDEDQVKKLEESEEGSEDDEIDGETVDETRLRLAKEYLKVPI
jgi:hypothetical protein